MNALLATRNVSFSYGDLPVLRDVSIELCAGEVCGILGPNGAGKSTLINVMNGTLDPTAGEVVLDGDSLASYSANDLARKIAVVAQESHIPFPFTALEIVLMGRAPYLPRMGFERRIDIEMSLHAMDAMDVKRLADRDIRELSGGERRRVIVARALAQQTDILLLDEPTNFLDVKHATELARLLRDHAKSRGIGVCAVMHDINLAAAACDRLVLLRDGSIVAAGTPHNIMKEDLLESAFGVRLAVTQAGPDRPPFCTPSLTP